MKKSEKIYLLIKNFHEKKPKLSRLTYFLFGGSLTLVISASAYNNYNINPVAQTDGVNAVYYPFGLSSLQPPDPTNVITIKAGIGVTAKQVCGYTDWSTAALVLPTQLMSSEYWTNVSKQLEYQAIQAVTALSGALPQMLACNVSPTFCHILNTAQQLAQTEFAFTADTCKLLDNVADALPKNTALATCIQTVMSDQPKYKISDPGQAREYCIVSNGTDYNSKIASVSSKGKDNKYGFSSDKILDLICPESRKTKITEGLSANYKSGPHVYSSIQNTCSFAEKLLPGFDIQYDARVTRAGTFQSTVSNLIEENQKNMSDDIMLVVNQMYSEYRKGKTPNQVIASAASNWAPATMESKRRAPLYMRGSSNGAAPQFLIPPQQMYELVQLIDPTLKGSSFDDTVQANYKNTSSPFRQALDRVVGSASYISTLDSMNDLRSRVLDACASSSDLQGEAAQGNCTMMQAKLASQMQYLQTRMDAEQSILAMQKDVNSYVQNVLRDRSKNQKVGSLPLQSFDNKTGINPSKM
ncbi:MAG: hypothetical protein K2X69_13005 [Silvanigrellaceae bacterium]|nr:hypothetical protein [Silvanigrellaceae bacterium]